MNETNEMLLHAAYEGDNKRVLQALELGADVNAVDRYSMTPLMLARQHLATVRLLVQRGANLEAATHSGVTALHYMSRVGMVDAVKELLAAGANVNCRTNAGTTPLIFAVDYKHVITAMILIEAGSDVKLRDYRGTAWIWLDVAIMSSGSRY